MASILEIDGKLLHPIKDAASVVSYSRDYITRLARDKKIVASYVGRQWFIDLDSLNKYVELATVEQEIRKRNLREERISEKELRESVKRQQKLHLKKAESINYRATTVAAAVLCFGLFGGFAAHQSVTFSESSGFHLLRSQTAQVSLTAQDQSEVFVGSDLAAGIEDDVQVVTTHFTQEIKSIGDVQNGIMLFPGNASTTVIEEMLSDEVMVRESPDGTQTVVRIDEDGNTVGKALPFVVVPVERQKI